MVEFFCGKREGIERRNKKILSQIYPPVFSMLLVFSCFQSRPNRSETSCSLGFQTIKKPEPHKPVFLASSSLAQRPNRDLGFHSLVRYLWFKIKSFVLLLCLSGVERVHPHIGQQILCPTICVPALNCCHLTQISLPFQLPNSVTWHPNSFPKLPFHVCCFLAPKFVETKSLFLFL